MSIIRLGIIGMSEGNGHPYSWSAIINGYDPGEMEACGFPVIPRYLELRSFPKDAIAEAKVTHVWAQDKKIALHIAKATLIENVVDHYTDLIGQVDAVLLARDDAESHLEFALPFLQAGLPIYIDKPLALSMADAKRLIDAQRYPGQLFSCSALRYAQELHLSEPERMRLGSIHHIHATVPKDWEKYAIHVIEPSLLLVDDRGTLIDTAKCNTSDSTILAVRFEKGLQLLITTFGKVCAPISIRVFGENDWKDLLFQDTFSAFKGALNDFVQGVIHRDVRIEPDFMIETVRIIEAGRRYE